MAPILSSPAPGPLRLRPRALVGTRRESPGEKADCATGDGQPEILGKLVQAQLHVGRRGRVVGRRVEGVTGVVYVNYRVSPVQCPRSAQIEPLVPHLLPQTRFPHQPAGTRPRTRTLYFPPMWRPIRHLPSSIHGQTVFLQDCWQLRLGRASPISKREPPQAHPSPPGTHLVSPATRGPSEVSSGMVASRSET